MHCVGFLGELGQRFNREAPAPVDAAKWLGCSASSMSYWSDNAAAAQWRGGDFQRTCRLLVRLTHDTTLRSGIICAGKETTMRRFMLTLTVIFFVLLAGVMHADPPAAKPPIITGTLERFKETSEAAEPPHRHGSRP